jgi:hypothetical protein
LTKLLDGRITSLRLETEIEDFLVEAHYEGKAPLKPSYAYGRLKGTIQTLSARHGIRFTLYDVLFDRPISCYLKEGQEDLIREYWGKKVHVSGKMAETPKMEGLLPFERFPKSSPLKVSTADFCGPWVSLILAKTKRQKASSARSVDIPLTNSPRNAPSNTLGSNTSCSQAVRIEDASVRPRAFTVRRGDRRRRLERRQRLIRH